MKTLVNWWYQLLAWLRGESAAEFYILIGSHGNEPIWRPLLRLFKQSPIRGVRWRFVHKRAAKKGERHLGKLGQIMNCYPGRLFGNAEERAAWWTMRWLGARRNNWWTRTMLWLVRWRPRRNNPRTVIIDIHDVDDPRLNLFMVGPRVSRAAIVAAYELGFRRCVVVFNPAMLLMENAVLLENGAANDIDRERIAGELHRGLQRLQKIGVKALEERYEACVSKIEFFFSYEVMIGTPDTGRNDWLWPVLPELEAFEPQQPFTPLPPMSEAAELALGLLPDEESFIGLWGNTMSKVWPEVGLTARRRPRNECLGVVYHSAGAPPFTYGRHRVGWVRPAFYAGYPSPDSP